MSGTCNICGSNSFRDVKARKNAICSECGAFERTRMLKLYLDKLNLSSDARVLHLGPEKGLAKFLENHVGNDNYTAADFAPEPFRRYCDCKFIDLCDMESWEDNSFDLIVHSHVMEHTPCNIAYSLFHLDRILKPNGLQLCIIPFLPGRWDECFQDISDEERTERFGQFDHVRRFGTEDINSHLGKIVKLPKGFDATLDFDEETLRKYNIPESQWRGFHPGTILHLKKGDYLLR